MQCFTSLVINKKINVNSKWLRGNEFGGNLVVLTIKCGRVK